MSYTSILVHLDTSAAAERRLEFSLRLAHQFGAHLQALLTAVPPDWARSYAMAEAVERLIEHERLSTERAQSLEHSFKTEASHLKVSGEWSVSNGDASEAVASAARIADLVITGQRDPDDPESLVTESFAADLVLRSGRPVLFVPYTGAIPTIGTRVLVAWDGSREAARAVSDAMPFICRARQTTVVTVNAREGRSPANRLPGADIASTLARHGAHVVTSELEGIPHAGIGDALLSRAADLGADLIVMGGYAHSRWREMVLGGVTRAMLGAMTVPVLMSH